jgi:hypothetical protein
MSPIIAVAAGAARPVDSKIINIQKYSGLSGPEYDMINNE